MAIGIGTVPVSTDRIVGCSIQELSFRRAVIYLCNEYLLVLKNCNFMTMDQVNAQMSRLILHIVGTIFTIL